MNAMQGKILSAMLFLATAGLLVGCESGEGSFFTGDEKQASPNGESKAGSGPSPSDASADENATMASSQHPVGVIGAVELVRVDQIDLVLPARIDTGANTSSIDAQNIETFERDGKQWVRFTVQPRPLDQPFEPGEDEWPEGTRPEPVSCERPVTESILIESGEGADEERYVVEFSIVMGTHRLAGEFSLNDRSEFEYGVLIGRNLLAGSAMVDVGRSRVLGKPKVEKDGDT
jgi:hypothetical protein